MKRYIITIAALFISVLALADEVSIQRAGNYAKQRFEARGVELAWSGSNKDMDAAESESPAFYIFNLEGGGWTIISGDDCASPVLAYSKTGFFNAQDMPDNMRSWLAKTGSNIIKARKNKLIAGSAIRKEWVISRPRVGDAGVKVLETASWDQSYPYNYQCPSDHGQKSLTGCVATSTSIVIRYHQHPEHGTGTLSSYTTVSKGIRVSGYSIENHHYDYDLMPLTYNRYNPWSQDQVNAVSQLIHDVGVMVEMDYTSEGSGAFTEDVPAKLVKHMGYSSSTKYLYRRDYTNKEWVEMIREEIDNNRPLIYSGQDLHGGGGHAFVCDGYDQVGNVHINWGWSGSLNCFANVTYLDSKNGVFSADDGAIFGIKPAEEGESTDYTEEPVLVLTSYNGNKGIEITGDFAKGNTLSFKAGTIWNDGAVRFSAKLQAAHLGIDGTVKETWENSSTTTIYAGCTSSYRINITINETVEPGDVLCLRMQLPDGTWKRVRSYDLDTVPAIDEYGAIDTYLIRMEDKIRTGILYYPELITGQDQHTSVAWYLDGVRIPSNAVNVKTPGQHTIKAVVSYKNGKDVVCKHFVAE